MGAIHRPDSDRPLPLEPVTCCVCGSDDAEPLAVGEDFEYRTSPDTFLAVQCRCCGLVYLNPRPAMTTLDRIYPLDYHAFDFSAERYGLIYRVRQRLEAKRLLSACQRLGPGARLLDVGCGDGFHLKLLRQFGRSDWQLEGVDMSDRAVALGRQQGLKLHQGTIQAVDLPAHQYDLAFMIATLEHVDDPAEVIQAVRRLLKPGGELVIVTDNTDTWDFRLFGHRHWGGYHFPRHWNLFNANTVGRLAMETDLEVVKIQTIVSPVNWVYSIHNYLVDWNAASWLVKQFSLESTLSLGFFTLFDQVFQAFGHGALLRVTLRRPFEN